MSTDDQLATSERTSMKRREALKAAWAAPVVAVAATAAPGAASSYEDGVCVDKGGKGKITYGRRSLVVHYYEVPDIYEINVRYHDGTQESFGTNYGTAPRPGTRVWRVPIRDCPEWVQVHWFNSHIGEDC